MYSFSRLDREYFIAASGLSKRG